MRPHRPDRGRLPVAALGTHCPRPSPHGCIGGKLTPEMKADIIKGIPLNRLGDAKDVANIYLFLAPPTSPLTSLEQ